MLAIGHSIDIINYEKKRLIFAVRYKMTNFAYLQMTCTHEL